MNAAGVFFLSLFTSIIGAAGAVYAIERFELLPKSAPVVEQVAVPTVEGLPEADARSNLAALGLAMLVGPREASPSAAEGTVIKQSVMPGQKLAKGEPITVTLAKARPKIPDVVGKTVEEAEKLVKTLEMKVEVEAQVPSDKVSKGQIISQMPEAGAPQPEGPLKVKVSAGLDEVEVPKVAGFTINNAKKLLGEAGLEPEIHWTARAETMEYLVLQQTPKPGDKLKPGEKVRLVVNSGD